MSKTILLIDDEKETIDIVRKQMQQAGYQAQVAYNGKEGLDAAIAIHPHLILTDIAMPVMDGLMFYQELKNHLSVSHIPVMVATAYGTNQERMRDLGVKDFLVKPFDRTILINKVENFFEKQRANQILIATKMQHLMKTILSETNNVSSALNVHITNDTQTIIAQAQNLRPQVILLDVDMFISPTASEVVKTLRKTDGLQETCILLMRSMLLDFSIGGLNAKQAIVEECLANGASHYAGHLNREAFLAMIKDYCIK